MKKVLFATTALIATAGVAAADVAVGGFGFAGASFDGATNSTTASSGMRLTFTGSVETDGGVSMTAYTRVTNGTPGSSPGLVGKAKKGTTPAAPAAPGEAIGGDIFARNKITISASGLTFAVGSTNGAMKSLARNAAFMGYNDGGVFSVDNNVSGLNDSGNNMLVTYTTGSFTVGVGSDITGATMDIGVKYSANGFTVGLGADSAAGTNWMAMVAYDGGQWNVGLGGASNNDITFKAGYDVSAATSLGLAVESTGGNTDFGLNVSHDLGGATASFTAGQKTGNTVAGAGIFFKF